MKPGTLVEHQTFGLGVVANVQGDIISIDFIDGQVKRFSLTVALKETCCSAERRLEEERYDQGNCEGSLFFLAQKSDFAKEEDLDVARDLLDTLGAHQDGCVGMAANMIGVAKRIIAFDDNGEYMVMFNPEIVKCWEPFETEEGCLSLTGREKQNGIAR